MKKTTIPVEILNKLKSVKAKRAKTVIDHIIKHGFITTEDLKETYGYNHPPRAARDVREQGIPLETFKVKDSTGRSIGAYRFGEWSEFRSDKLHGRRAFSKLFKDELISYYGEKCLVCSGKFKKRYLQIDHRIPYEVTGDGRSHTQNTKDYMLLCSTCNRAKSWSCEHCENWQGKRDVKTCGSCYWGSPEKHRHIAMEDIRRLEIVWQGKEVSQFDKIKQIAKHSKQDLPEFIKEIILKSIEGE